MLMGSPLSISFMGEQSMCLVDHHHRIIIIITAKRLKGDQVAERQTPSYRLSLTSIDHSLLLYSTSTGTVLYRDAIIRRNSTVYILFQPSLALSDRWTSILCHYSDKQKH